MKNFTKFAVVAAALVFSMAGTPAQPNCPTPGAKETAGNVQSQTKTKGKVVYVCACLRTKSCSCMSMAKTEGPCACGTEGGPPMKAVPANSAWAKENRQALSK